MKILFIYPHPDDESFGPAAVMAKQVGEGHKVYLLTLTKGGATKQRLKYNYTIKEMGEIRANEMECVKNTLGLTGMKILDLPDSGLKEMDPRKLELVIEDEIKLIEPNVIVTYPVHGISGFHDHLITHAAVKSVFVKLKDNLPGLRRLAFTTIAKETAEKSVHFKLNFSTEEEIDCVVKVSDEDIRKNLDALDCYTTYADMIKASGVKDLMTTQFPFEFYMENFNPPTEDLFYGLNR